MTTYTEMLAAKQAEETRLTDLLDSLPKPQAKGKWEWSVNDRRTYLLIRKNSLQAHPYAMLMLPGELATSHQIGICVGSEWSWLDDRIEKLEDAARRICQLADQRVEHESEVSK